MWFLAIRHLISRRKQTVITLLGVALGVTAFVAFSSIMMGFQDYIIDQLVNNDAHVRVSKREQVILEHSLDKNFYPDAENIFWKVPPSGKKDNSKIEDPLSWFDRLKADPRVLALTPQLTASVLFVKGGSSKAGQIVGSEPYKQIRISNIRNYMTEGDYLSLGFGGGKLVVGDGLLQTLGARVGDSIFVSSGQSGLTPFKIVGKFHLGIKPIDDARAFGSLTDIQALNKTPSLITDIAIRLTDVNYASEFAANYALLSRDKVESWDQVNANILSVFSMQNFIRNFISISIMIVASFGIYNILSILVNQKRKDIGILRSVGFDRKDIVKLFLIQGLILGITGGVLGLGFGFLISTYLGTLKIGGMVDKMIISFSSKIYLSGLIEAVAASTLSSILPARSAGELKPIDIIRSGD